MEFFKNVFKKKTETGIDLSKRQTLETLGKAAVGTAVVAAGLTTLNNITTGESGVVQQEQEVVEIIKRMADMTTDRAEIRSELNKLGWSDGNDGDEEFARFEKLGYYNN